MHVRSSISAKQINELANGNRRGRKRAHQPATWPSGRSTTNAEAHAAAIDVYEATASSERSSSCSQLRDALPTPTRSVPATSRSSPTSRHHPQLRLPREPARPPRSSRASRSSASATPTQERAEACHDWEIELKIPQKHVGQVLARSKTCRTGAELEWTCSHAQRRRGLVHGKLQQGQDRLGRPNPNNATTTTSPNRSSSPGPASRRRHPGGIAVPPELLLSGTEVHTPASAAATTRWATRSSTACGSSCTKKSSSRSFREAFVFLPSPLGEGPGRILPLPSGERDGVRGVARTSLVRYARLVQGAATSPQPLSRGERGSRRFNAIAG